MHPTGYSRRVAGARIGVRRAAEGTSTATLLAVALTPGAVFLSFFVWRASANPFGARRFTLFDDAMISMTYARTLADTGELTWFPGAPRVQGFTNPLWTLFMAGLHRIGLEGSSAALAVSLTGVALILTTAVFVFSLVARTLGATPEATIAGVAAAGAVPFMYPLAFWTLRGMEVGLLALALVVMLWGAPIGRPVTAIDRSTVIAGAAGAVGVLTRLDFAILVAGVATCCALWTPGWRPSARVLTVLAAPAVAAGTAVLAAPRLYYGDWLPNTYRLKMEGVVLQVRVHRGLLTSGKVLPLLVVLLAATVAAFSRGDEAVRKLSAAVATSALLAVAYNVWVGGDAWETGLLFNRYVSVVLPAALVLVTVGAVVISRALRPIRRWTAIAPLMAFACVTAGASSNTLTFRPGYAVAMTVATSLGLVAVAGAVALRSRLRSGTGSSLPLVGAGVVLVASIVAALPTFQWIRTGGLHVGDDQSRTEEGLALAATTADDAVIATTWAGAPAYYSSRAMVDLLGKSDRRIASMDGIGTFRPGHDKWDHRYSIGELRPDVVFKAVNLTTVERELLVDWGYEAGCLDVPGVEPSYFRTDSEAVLWPTVVPCADNR